MSIFIKKINEWSAMIYQTLASLTVDPKREAHDSRSASISILKFNEKQNFKSQSKNKISSLVR